MTVQVRVLGPLEVIVDGEAVTVGGARLRALLVRLALEAGRFVAVESLARPLWPEHGPVDPVHAVQSLVSRLRRTLPEEVVRQGPGGYRLDVPPEAVDATRFERLAGEGRRALRDGDPGTAAELLREALTLWRGEPLLDVLDESYAEPVVVRLRELRLGAVEDRVAADLGTGRELGSSMAELEELVAAHPLRERLRDLRIRALHGQGRQAEALSAYEDFRRLLADELGADPGPDLQATHLMVLQGGGGATSPEPRGNLRAPLTSFVGRTRERALIAERLREGRLVTLVGPGGVGKSRLAAKAAGELADEFPGGGWLVELAPVTDPAELVRTVAGTLGTAAAPATVAQPRDQMSRLAEAFPAAETLIVLDNCEHLIEASARFAEDLLGRCPQLRILATSREPLGVLGEALCPVPPLSSADAAQLFVDRAQALRPGVAEADDGAVTEICGRLDGLPLAIELAAARLRFLPPDQLAVRLDDRFRQLTGGSRTAMPRHRTLHAVVAWSWELLTDDERRAAERLAVFPGTFTPEAAARVSGHDLADELANKSLLQFTEGPRYWMLDTIREYALDRLAESGEVTRAHQAHAGYVLDLAERAKPRLIGPEQLGWIRTLRTERDNLLAAVHFACDSGDADTAARLGTALGLFWTIVEDHGEVAGRLRLILDVASDPTVAAVYLLNTVLSGDSTPTMSEVDRFRSLARDAEPVTGTVIEAIVAMFTGDVAAGIAAIDACGTSPDPWTRGLLEFIRSALDGSLGDMAAMRADLESAVAAFRQSGERWALATSLSNLAFAYSTLGEFDESVAALEESMSLSRELGTGDGDRIWLAMLRVQIGDPERARLDLHEVLARNPAAPLIARASALLASLARFDGDLAEAARHLERAAQHSGPHDSSSAVLLRLGQGQLEVATGELTSARQRLTEAVTLAAATGDLPLVGLVAVGVAELSLARKVPDAAAKLLGAAHALRGGANERHPDVVRLTGALRDELGERFQELYSHGRRLDRAVALALVESEAHRSRSAP